ncbi:hypothetical protein [Parasitella parasitica]|uniref:Uncharacterized protein n=1 Tax=Parasitella parasitica TaxID=35722 RepID=A0A0B7MS11_9FUNG|nr:hypothetical protein [Parasitella parasitica]
MPGPEARYTDALSISWTNFQNLFANPPWNPISSALNKISQERLPMVTLVGGFLLAQCPLVFSGTMYGSLSPMNDVTTSGTDDLSQDAPTVTTTKLDALRVEIIRNQLLRTELNVQAVEHLVTQKLAPTGTNLSYRKNQLRFFLE